MLLSHGLILLESKKISSIKISQEQLDVRVLVRPIDFIGCFMVYFMGHDLCF
ncbi:unnamed protein product [Arabidopsis lyrata]|nr:unnamed protein product [Arabidopsis lyrata]